MTVALGSDGLILDGQREPLVAAQFEYFRNSPAYWETILDRIRGAGITMVSIFICWDFHEPAIGEFDLDGRTDPARNLVRFLELCADKNLLVLARPGPFIDAEWETRGPAPDVMNLERLHPRFLKRMEDWYAAVSEVLVPAQVTRGGPVVMVGVDNQTVHPWPTSEGLHRTDGDVQRPYDADYHDSEFRTWLRDEYDSLDELNHHLDTEFSDWSEVRSPRFACDPPAFSQAGFRFLNVYLQRFFDYCEQYLRNRGVDVPLYANMFQFLAHVDWPIASGALDSAGMDLFMPRNMVGEQGLVANWWYRLHRARYRFPWAAEFQSGWIGLFEDFGFLSPEHGEYMPMSAQAAGLEGMSFYMFVERDDWAHAPVNALGKVRPERYERFQQVVRSLRAADGSRTQLCDIGLIWNIHDHQALMIHEEPDWAFLWERCNAFDTPKEQPVWWETFRTLVDADVDFEIWIPGRSGDPPPILIHAGLPCTDPDFLRALDDVAQGRTLLEVSPLPDRNLSGHALDSLSKLRGAIREKGECVTTSLDALTPTLDQVGARRYARAEGADPGARVWSYLYRLQDGRLVLGLWNAGNVAFDGVVRLDLDTAPQSRTWSVREPRKELSWHSIEAERLSVMPIGLPQHSARVLELSPDSPTQDVTNLPTVAEL